MRGRNCGCKGPETWKGEQMRKLDSKLGGGWEVGVGGRG